MAAKWPPRSNSDQCSIRSSGSSNRRTSRSAAKAAHPCGVSAWGKPLARVGGLVEEVGGGGARASEPIDAHVRQQLIAVDRILGELGAGVGPLPELLDDPRKLRDGRIREAERDRLRAGRLQLQVALALGRVSNEVLDTFALMLRELL